MADFNVDFVRFRAMANLDDAMRLIQAPTAVESDPCVYVFRDVRRKNCYRNMCAKFDQCVRDVASDRLAPVYWQNTTPASVGITSRLCKLLWHHHPARNPDALAAFGVNEPSVYVSGRYALTDLHVDDNYLDSANMIRFGAVGSGKVWLLVHPRSFYDLTVALGDSIGRLRVLGRDDISDYLEGCPTPDNNKNICITSEYLQARKIPHQFITQRSGDLVYVGPGIYH
ncbi:hypothetical protein TSAR_013399 [Trichomalopsis sarcophagae]|uniref:JmjC domain-containing protein n=1 Tax=Trichomalopsis sarcophagae TaxID=543379 RepID=A0A232EEB7_9HYME|nr:hypothetical protein TSAR_013399 [Trichomalopsis sarcophagae]